MKKFLSIILILLSAAAHSQQNQPSVGYRFWGWAKVGGGVSDNTNPPPTAAFQVGRPGGNQGLYLVPQDTLTIVNPVQGLVIGLSTDLGRLWQFNGTYWERFFGGSGTPGGPFENPLGFSNGLTRTVNSITWGGNLQGNTLINANNNNILFNNTQLGINQLTPQYSLDITGSARITVLPQVNARDTLLTYVPGTKQIGYTVRPRCADSATNILLQVGIDTIPSGAGSYTTAELVGKTIKLFREGELQSPDLYTYNPNTGTIFFTPVLNYRERLRIEMLCLTSFTPSQQNLISEAGNTIITENGQTLIYQ